MESKMFVEGDEIHYKNEKDEYHREDGPAIINEKTGFEVWYFNGKVHRIDGPAYKYSDREEYYVNGELHRIDSPVVIHAYGLKIYYQQGRLHRLNGPAIESPSGEKVYYLCGEHLPKDLFDLKIETMKQIVLSVLGHQS